MKEKEKTTGDRISDFLKCAAIYFFIAYFILGIILGELLLGPREHPSLGLLVFIGIVSLIIAAYAAYIKISREIKEDRAGKELREKEKLPKETKETQKLPKKSELK